MSSLARSFLPGFNAFKSEIADRQIGERRMVNMTEMGFDGPSKFLPPRGSFDPAEGTRSPF